MSPSEFVELPPFPPEGKSKIGRATPVGQVPTGGTEYSSGAGQDTLETSETSQRVPGKSHKIPLTSMK